MRRRPDGEDPDAAVRALRARADGKDEAYFAFRGIDGPRTVYERLLRLGSVIAWCETAVGDRRAEWWKNGSARIAVPEATTVPSSRLPRASRAAAVTWRRSTSTLLFLRARRPPGAPVS